MSARASGKRLLALPVATVLALSLSACGGDGGKDDGPEVSGAKGMTSEEAAKVVEDLLGPIPAVEGSTSRGVEGKVIKIGGTGTNTKAGQQTLPGLDAGAAARFARANREGGVNGYTFDYVGFEDDHGIPGDSQRATQELVESKKAFALVPYASLPGFNRDFLVKNKVPVFGFLGQDYCSWGENPMTYSVFGASTCADVFPGKAVGMSAPYESLLKAIGKPASDIKLAVFTASDPSSVATLNSTRSIAAGLGIEVVYAKGALPSATEPPLTDYTPIANEILSSGANVVTSAATAPGTLGVLGALKGLGWKGDFNYNSGVQAFLDNPQTAQIVDGMYASLNTGAEPLDPQAFAQVKQDLEAVGSRAPVDGLGTVTTYWAADLFLQAFAKIEGEPTVEKLVGVLNKGDFAYQEIPGVTCKQIWPVGRLLTATCGGVLRYDSKSKSLVAAQPYQQAGRYFFADKG